MILIGLTGPAFAGKDTVGHYLADRHEFTTLAFADPIREGLRAMLDLRPHHFRPENKERVIEWIGQSPRQLMQTLGTEWGRQHVASDLWCRCMRQRISGAQADECIVITDVRFADEAAMIRQHGGTIWLIERPGADTTAHSGHVSESGTGIEADITLTNNGTLEQLYEQIDAVFEAQLDKMLDEGPEGVCWHLPALDRNGEAA